MKDNFNTIKDLFKNKGERLQNEKFQFNEMTYLRRSVKISEEFIEENICIKWI
jgi:hypothetical protein|tara:strand:- start:637 stop:795 length:159 start_codon:yes stop_codon:yes gene_type:complete